MIWFGFVSYNTQVYSCRPDCPPNPTSNRPNPTSNHSNPTFHRPYPTSNRLYPTCKRPNPTLGPTQVRSTAAPRC